MWHHVGHGKDAPPAKLPARLRQSAQHQLWIDRIQSPHHAGQEGRNEVTLRPRPPHRADYDLLHPAHFDLNIEKRRARISIKNIFQARWPFFSRDKAGLQLFECVFAYDQAIEAGIMANNGLPVAGAANIELKTINAMFEREIKSRDGIFRRIEPGAAMSEQ